MNLGNKYKEMTLIYCSSHKSYQQQLLDRSIIDRIGIILTINIGALIIADQAGKSLYEIKANGLSNVDQSMLTKPVLQKNINQLTMIKIQTRNSILINNGLVVRGTKNLDLILSYASTSAKL